MDSSLSITIVQLVVSIVLAAIAIVPPLVKQRSDAKKTSADSEGVIVDKALGMVESWDQRCARAETELEACRQAKEQLLKGAYRLLNQMKEHNIAPCWEPNGLGIPTEPKK